MSELFSNLGATSSALDSVNAAAAFWPLSSYETIRSTSLVPATLAEFRPLAAEMPVAFARSRGEVYAAAIIGLPGLNNLISGDAMPVSLPLLLRAFPLGVGPSDAEGRPTVVISEPPAGEITPGEPAFLADGSMGPALQEKTDALWLFVKAQEDGAAALRSLEAHGAFEAWPLQLVFDDGALPVSELLRIRADYLQSDAFVDFYNLHGFDLAIALHYHRISLNAIDRLARLDPLAVK